MNGTKPKQYVVLAIRDDSATIVGTYRSEDAARGSATLVDGHVLEIEFEVEESVYGKGITYLADWLER